VGNQRPVHTTDYAALSLIMPGSCNSPSLTMCKPLPHRFDQLGYGTLNTYYADSSVEGCEGKGKQIFRQYMSKVAAG